MPAQGPPDEYAGVFALWELSGWAGESPHSHRLPALDRPMHGDDESSPPRRRREPPADGCASSKALCTQDFATLWLGRPTPEGDALARPACWSTPARWADVACGSLSTGPRKWARYRRAECISTAASMASSMRQGRPALFAAGLASPATAWRRQMRRTSGEALRIADATVRASRVKTIFTVAPRPTYPTDLRCAEEFLREVGRNRPGWIRAYPSVKS